MSTLMASAISASTYLCSSSLTNTKSTTSYLYTSLVSCPNFVPQLGLSQFSPWNGLRPLSISISQKSLKIERKRRYRGKVVYASLFGVGAPEALVIGVVALLVFGPKGLAEVARNLGKTLRAFQPTIRELQEVSREFKSSLEREIGLDESSSSAPSTYRSNTTNIASSPISNAETEDSQDLVDPNGASLPNRAYTSEEYLKITEEQLKASTGQQQGQMPPVPHDNQLDAKTQPQGSVQGAAAAAAIPPSEKSGRSTS